MWLLLLLLLVACRTPRTSTPVPGSESVQLQRPAPDPSQPKRPTTPQLNQAEPPEPPLISLVEPFNYASLSVATNTLDVLLLLIDPGGKSLGFDLSSQRTVEQVIGGDLGSHSITDPATGRKLESRWIEVIQAPKGLYTLMISAQKPTTYTLSIGGESKGGTHQTLNTAGPTSIKPSQTHVYQFSYSQGIWSDPKPKRLR